MDYLERMIELQGAIDAEDSTLFTRAHAWDQIKVLMAQNSVDIIQKLKAYKEAMSGTPV